MPTREQLQAGRFTRWLAPFLGHAKLWHWSRRGVAAGQIRPDADLDAMVDALYAPIFLRILLRHRPLDDAFIRHIADLVFSGLRPR